MTMKMKRIIKRSVCAAAVSGVAWLLPQAASAQIT
jgi:hypothetical protein